MELNGVFFIAGLLNILIIVGAIAGVICIVVSILSINKGVKATNKKLDELIKLREQGTTNEKLDQVIEILKKDIN
ncbi:hypothetical protein [Clostridium sp.]|uniref:hypothetical protein n=1 Tax=Clostridium sp. TaxID=1506 RepID=UPI0032163960